MELIKINTTNYYIIVLNKSGFTQNQSNKSSNQYESKTIQEWY